MTGVARMVRFNWPHYLAGASVALVAILLGTSNGLPPGLRLLSAAIAASAAWWVAASLAAGYVVYDRSPLSRWRWLANLPAQRPSRWAVVTAGYDEASVPLRRLLGGRAVTVDLYDPSLMTEASIRRAHRVAPPPSDSLTASPDELPLLDGQQDALFVVFAAHELRRRRERQALFGELRRVCREGGAIVLVEHGRDSANLLAFGPGALHFFPYREWLGLASEARLRLVDECRVTPFVRALVFAR
jgi:SAM-dependent methyltransferase